jgi:hypothetical protein
MGFLRKTKGSIISDYFKVLQDIGEIKSGYTTNVIVYADRVELKSTLIKEKKIIKIEQITDVYYGVQKDIVEVNKSVIGRAVVGGLLFGDVGAIVGAVSGIGTKKKQEARWVFIISYTENGKDRYLQFEDTRMYRGRKVAAKLKELCNIH